MRLGRLALAAIGLASAARSRPAPPPRAVFPYGVSWYPEQEAEGDWAADLDLMTTAHVTFVRMAECAWAELEPREGAYDFAWR